MFIVDQDGDAVLGNIPEGAREEPGAIAPGIPSFIQVGFARYLVNEATIPTANWTIALMNPTSELEQGARSSIRAITPFTALCMVLAMVLTAFFIRSFLTPLGQVIRSIRAIHGGDHEERLRVTRRDEIGYLATSFNQMLDRISRRRRRTRS